MNYASIEQISKAYGERIIFQNISFGINAGQKIGLIAKNGTGKTSLLKILSGQDHPDEGEINYRNDIKISFLSQEPDLDENLTVEETIFASENEILKVIAQYALGLKAGMSLVSTSVIVKVPETESSLVSGSTSTSSVTSPVSESPSPTVTYYNE